MTRMGVPVAVDSLPQGVNGKKREKNNEGKSKPLIATNVSEIATYGQRAMQLDFGLGSQYNWEFYVADIPCL